MRMPGLLLATGRVGVLRGIGAACGYRHHRQKQRDPEVHGATCAV